MIHSYRKRIFYCRSVMALAILFNPGFSEGVELRYESPQKQRLSSNQEDLKKISRVDKIAKSIDRSSRGAKKVKKTLVGTDGGGELIACFRDGHLQKIDVHLGFSNKTTVTKYYFYKRQLVLVSDKIQYFAWNSQKKIIDRSKYGSTRQTMCYFENRKVYHCVSSDSTNIDLAKIQVELLKRADQFKNIALSPAVTIYLN